MSFVLDTNAVSAVMKGEARTLSRLRDAAKREVFVPQPVLAEISYGIARLPKSKRKESLRQRFELVKGELLRTALLRRELTPHNSFSKVHIKLNLLALPWDLTALCVSRHV